MFIHRLWEKFRALPVWVQLIAWLLLAPFLAAVALWRLPGGRIPARVTAVALLVVFAPAYAAALSGGRPAPSAQGGVVGPPEELSGPSPTPEEPVAPPAAPSPSPQPSLPPQPAPPPSATVVVPAGPSAVPAGAQRGVVERIVDGDTLWVRIDEPGGPLIAGASHKIRLLEIDTPETVAPGQPVECFGPEASAFAKQDLAVGSTVYLLADKEDTDRYGRFLRYLWTASGDFYNEKAVRLGYATAVLSMPNDRYIGLMRQAEQEAKAARRGLWGTCATTAPAQSSPTPRAPTTAAASPAGGCHPSYQGTCIPVNVPDADCAGGSGNGPYYVQEQNFAVVGPDDFILDADGNGIGCQK